MGFFKRLFSSGRKSEQGPNERPVDFKGIHSKESFDERYREDAIAPEMLDGCLKMIGSYFHDNKIQPLNPDLINDPKNLDQVDQEGFGFVLYCQAFNLEEVQATLFLAFAFAAFLIDKYGFKLYRDSQPEQPLRGMTLKYDQSGVLLSLYPFEYASKVLNGDARFTDLEQKIHAQLGEMPDLEAIVRRFTGTENDPGNE